MKLNKDDIYSAIGTVVFHGILLLILGLSVLKTEIPEDEGGVLVNFGNIDAAAGLFEPQAQEPTPEATTPPPSLPDPPIETTEQELITQDLEESVALEDDKEKKREREEAERLRKEEEQRQREEAERLRIAEERRKQQEAIRDKVAGAFSGKGNTNGTNQGDASTGKGNQGSPFGNADHGANEGVGYGFSLDGRTYNGTGDFPRPGYNIQEEGRIVIDITVNPQGKVIYAEIGKGTNIDNINLRKEALNAARRVVFNSIHAVNNQMGTITYNFKFK